MKNPRIYNFIYKNIFMKIINFPKKILKEMENFMSAIAVIYATLIVKGLKTYSQVPASIKAKVKEVLIGLEMGDLATEEDETPAA